MIDILKLTKLPEQYDAEKQFVVHLAYCIYLVVKIMIEADYEVI